MHLRFARGFDIDAARRHLRREDPALASWMRRLPPLEPPPRWRGQFDTVDVLARAILYQQLSGKAAATIVGRVEAACGEKRLDAAALMRLSDAEIRACGVSGNKTLALRDLAARGQRGELPAARAFQHLDDETIVERLTAVRGIGRWTVEMLLIFTLGRPDVLAVDDLGLRRGVQVLDGLADMPTTRELAARGEVWGPFRSCASMLLWRIADQRAA
ncbi:MAG TPA: DNA-3-methyladenine glycosylase 2 family protein [Xanthomonadaceae bacterium]|nr:DNA-3-methyladenine glycosylase 2 family protein [Xanthomonadaceae bacterium]